MINWAENLPDIKPKYLAITQLVKQLIETEQLLPGQKIPAERSLARWLSVDRSTVSRALSELTIQGLLTKKRGSGTFVSRNPDLKPLLANINWEHLLDTVSNKSISIDEKLTQARLLAPDTIIDGAANELPSDLIPNLKNFDFDWQQYLDKQRFSGDPGYQDLLATLSQQQEIQQKIDLSNQTVMIAGGAEQSLLLILSSLLKQGDAIAYTTPSYFHSTAVFQTLGIRTFGVPLNFSNFNLAKLEETILKHRIKLLLLNPTLENPTGESLTLEQRQSILSLCQKYQIAIVEDDVFGWLINDKSSLPTLKTLSPSNVIYVSSLSKLLGSSTRIGWIIAPKVVGQKLLQVQKQLDMKPSMLAQEIVNSALNSPQFTLGLIKLTHELTKRRQETAALFKKYRPTWQFQVPEGGFYLWIKQTDPDIFNQLLAENILVKPGTIYGADKTSFRFNIARMDQSHLQLLEKILKK